jgi:phosphohistidine phosphatase
MRCLRDCAAVEIHLIRHGLSVEDALSVSDDRRHLSSKGRKIVREVGRTLHDLQTTYDAILASPQVRTVQTAELLAEKLDYLEVVEILSALAPGVPPQIAARELVSRGNRVAVIGQEPGLSMLGAYLTARPSFPPLRNAQVSVISDGKPLWFIHPETLAQERLLIA